MYLDDVVVYAPSQGASEEIGMSFPEIEECSLEAETLQM